MKKSFIPEPGSYPLPSTLEYDLEKQWLIGFELEIMDFLRIGAVFQDPDLYALLIELNGDRSGSLKDLALEIGYEKVNDTVGLYKGKLALPEDVRRIDLTTFALILPEIYLELYTNGDFRIDVGFPTDLDFSRSLKIEAFPYLGAGGFYIGRFSSETSTRTKVPSKEGFQQIAEFGLGLQLGAGKSIDQGVLKAGISVTLIGLLEGTIATYRTGSRFYWLKGVVGIAGELYGEVDLQIVTAAAKAAIQATAEGIFQAHKEAPLLLKTDVSANGEIRIGRGKFSRTFSRSFHKTIEVDFVVGENSRADWDEAAILPATDIIPFLDLKPLIAIRKKKLKLYFIPHFSLEEEGGQKVVKCTVMTYIDSLGKKQGLPDTSFHELLKGVFLWTVHAYLYRQNSGSGTDQAIMEKTIQLSELRTIHNLLTGYQGEAPRPHEQTKISYRNDAGKDIVSFINQYFEIEICDPEGGGHDLVQSLSYFPIFPDMSLLVERLPINQDQPVEEHNVEFNSFMRCSQKYRKELKEFIRKMMVDHQSQTERAYDRNLYKRAALADEDPSMATFFFEDYITMLAREAIHGAIEVIGEMPILVEELFQKDRLFKHDTVQRIASMTSCYMLFGMRVPKPCNTLFAPNTPVFPIYELVGQQFSIPVLQAGDKLFLTLTSNGLLPIKMKCCDSTEPAGDSLTVPLSQEDIERINGLLNATIPEDELCRTGALSPFHEVSQTFSAKNPIVWNTDKKLWFFSEPLSKWLESPQADSSGFQLKKSLENGFCTETLDWHEYILATRIDIDIRRHVSKPQLPVFASAEILYDIIGADDAGKRQLERLYAALRSDDNPPAIKAIHVLYPPDQDDPSLKLLSAKAPEFDVILTNLSTWTKPDSIRPPADLQLVVERLLKGCLIREEGCLLRYCDKGKGLPEEVFHTGSSAGPLRAHEEASKQAEGKITILIEYNQPTQVASFINCAILDSNKVKEEESWLLFENVNVKTKVPALPPGHVGIWVDRRKPQYNGLYNDEVVYLLQQFQQVGFNIKANNTFMGQQESALPIGALGSPRKPECPSTGEDPPEDMRYEAVIPVAQFAHQSWREQLPFASEQNDPYAGLGGSVEILLHLRDIFGNRLSQPEKSLSLPIWYNDVVVPAHQWPGTVMDYTFVDINSGRNGEPMNPGIRLSLRFDRSRFCNSTDPHVQLAREIYTRVSFQLRREDVRVYCQSSLTATADIPDGAVMPLPKAELLEYVDAIACYLNRSDSTSVCPDDKEPLFEHTAEVKLDNPSSIIELLLQFTIERGYDLVDPLMQDVEEVWRGVSMVLPLALKGMSTNTNSPSPVPNQTLLQFAELFQSFYQAKLAMGPSEKSKDNHRGIWVAKEMPSFHIHRDPFIFAPVPLSSSKQTYTFKVIPYDKTDDSGAVEKTFQELAAQHLAQECLMFIEEMLDPKYVDAVNQINGGLELQRILEAKKTIAEAIAQSVTHIGNMPEDPHPPLPPSSISEAQERYKQLLLARLSDAFEVDAIVQHHVTVTSPYTTADNIAPRLYGTLEGAEPLLTRKDARTGIEDTKEKNYAFSTAKLNLTSNETWLTYLFSTKKDGLSEIYKFPGMTYKIGHLEHRIRNTALGSYQSSSWLSFIQPDKITIGDSQESVDLPVMLKEYPKPMILKEHRDHYRPEAAANLKGACLWDYQFTYRSGEILEAQDRVKLVINLKQRQVEFSDVYQELVRALVQLHYAYCGEIDMGRNKISGIKEHMDEIMEGSSKKDKCPVYDAQHPVASFSKYAETLATAWSTWVSNDSHNRNFAYDMGQISCVIIEKASTEGLLIIAIESIQAAPEFDYPITIDIDGYEREQLVSRNAWKYFKWETQDGRRVKSYLTYDERKEDTNVERCVSVVGLDVLRTSQAWAGIYQTRNEELFRKSSGFIYKSVNETFIFRSQLTGFVSPIEPCLVSEQRFNIASIGSPAPTRKSLKEHLKTLCDALLRGNKHWIKGSVSYRHPMIVSAPKQWMLQVPNAMTLPFQYSDPSDMLDRLSRKLLALFDKADGPKRSTGMFTFDLAIYESMDNDKPVLRLQQLYLNVDQISDI